MYHIIVECPPVSQKIIVLIKYINVINVLHTYIHLYLLTYDFIFFWGGGVERFNQEGVDKILNLTCS